MTQTERIAVPAPAPARAAASSAPEPHGWIVDAGDVRPGRMEKSRFLALLRAEVCRAAEDALVGTGRSSKDCPYLDYWFSYYASRDAAQVERALLRYAPEAAGAPSAAHYIPIAVERVRKGIAQWARTPGADDAQAIRRQLGSGAPLPGEVRTRMESAFGHDFSRVRIHADDGAASLAARFDARAFTVGNDVAFASGAFHAGGVVSDALLAHELAHVVQQEGTGDSGAESSGALEEDAGRSAAVVAASLWAGTRAKLGDVARNAAPRLRSGLRLQRCSNKDQPTADQKKAAGSAAGPCAGEPNPLKPGLIPAIPVKFDCDAMIKDGPLDEIEKLGERGKTPLGVTVPKPPDRAYSIDGLGNSSYRAAWTARPKFELDPYVYTRAGTFATGKQDILDPPCAGKTVTIKKSVDRVLSEKVKAGEKEHCEDNKIAYGRSIARFEQFIDEMALGFCAEGDPDVEFRRRFRSRMGIELDDFKRAAQCLRARSLIRDDQGWHTVKNTAEPKYSKDCKEKLFVLDASTLTGVGNKLPAKDCGDGLGPVE